ncbi:hypothetical protein C8Q80DRAFT_1265773 [Daedaleopsis nitida]|nr:hypothetical protein C8Q80DRAFT_1265773 [Daedaleopsis nitida]
MSSEDERANIIADTLATLVSNYCANAGSSLVIYEYIITFGREVELFWHGRFTGAAALFYFNRYLNVVSNFYGLMQNVQTRDAVDCFVVLQNCPGIAVSSKVFSVLQYFPYAVFSGLRAFALTRNIPLATFIFLLSSVPIGINYAHFAFNYTGYNTPTGCLSTDDVSSELSKYVVLACMSRAALMCEDLIRSSVTIASRTCLIAADILLIYVTWFNMYRRIGVRHPITKNRFMSVLLKDGSIYFIVLAVLNSLHLTLSLLSIEYSTASKASYVTQFSDPLTTILVSRFLLHLQAVNRRMTIHLDSPDCTGVLTTFSQSDGGGSRYGYGNGKDVESIVFVRVVGSLAESLDTATSEYKDIFDWDEDEDSKRGELAIEKGEMKIVALEESDGRHDELGRGESMEMTPISSPRSAVGRSAA